jgi:hypothetical protein
MSTPLRITELIVRAGGLAEFAKADQIQVLRGEGKVETRFRFNYKTFLEGNFRQDILLQSRDMVIVP